MPALQTADDVRSEVLRDLDGKVPDAARGTVDQHALTGDDARLVDQCLQRRAAGDRQRGGDGIVDSVGNRKQAVVRHQDEVGQRAVACKRQQRAEHALSDMALRRATADADDLAGEIAAKAARAVPGKSGSSANHPARTFQSSGLSDTALDAHLRLAGPGQRLAHVLDAQHVGRAVALEPKRAHCESYCKSSACCFSASSGMTASVSSCVAVNTTGDATPASNA